MCRFTQKIVIEQGITEQKEGQYVRYRFNNVMGTWAYLSLSTWNLVHRNRDTELPMNDNVIETINMKSIKYMGLENDDGGNN